MITEEKDWIFDRSKYLQLFGSESKPLFFLLQRTLKSREKLERKEQRTKSKEREERVVEANCFVNALDMEYL